MIKDKSRVLVFASGDAEGGGSGFKELVENSRSGVLKAEVVAVVSQHENGGVSKIAKALGVPFESFKGSNTAKTYQAIWFKYGEPWVSLSGWVKKVTGIPAKRAFNIHPAPVGDYGGEGWHGHSVHDRVMAAFKAGAITQSAVCMHFATETYDDPGTLFFKYPVLIREDDTSDTLGSRVNKIEHGWQSWVTSLVVNEQIILLDTEPIVVMVPSWYFHLPFCPKGVIANPD